VAIINKNKIEKYFLVICQRKLIKHSKEYVTTFEREVLKLEEVSECFHVSGDYDYILKVFAKDMDAYRNFMVTKLTAIKYIGSTHSTFTIEQVKNTTAINL
jgi:Lrp/AsnC family leucine-responsive transcriptional regulator